jgi:hypothetical protein
MAHKVYKLQLNVIYETTNSKIEWIGKYSFSVKDVRMKRYVFCGGISLLKIMKIFYNLAANSQFHRFL